MRPSSAAGAIRPVAGVARPTPTIAWLSPPSKRCRRRKKRKHGHAARRQHGFFAGDARIAVLSAAISAKLGPCLKANVATGAHLLTDGSHLPGYKRQRAAAALMLPATTGAVDRLGRLVEGNLTGDPVYCDTQQTLPGFRP
jgi:hypothetical protein